MLYEKKKTTEHLAALSCDIIAIIIALFASTFLRYRELFTMESGLELRTVLLVMIVTYSTLGLLIGFYRYFVRRGVLEELRNLALQEISFGAVIVVFLFLIHRSTDISRLVFGFYFIFHFTIAFALRMLLKTYLLKVYKNSRYSNKMLVVVPRMKAEEVIDNLIAYKEWYRVIAGIALTDSTRLMDETIRDIPVVTTGVGLIDYVTHNNIDEVFISDCIAGNTENVKRWVKTMQQMGISVDVNIDIFDMVHSGRRTINRVGRYATVTFARNLYSTRQFMLKRTLDIIGSLVGLCITVLVFIPVAIAIKIDDPKGGIFFGQTRVGKNGRTFKFYKFRSMYADAEERKKELMAKNEMSGLMFKMEDDPRITKVGKFLRKTSLDELPQFWNVFKGDMSLVGTRPPTKDEYDSYEARHKCRLSMVPGLTGMWQVSGRSDITNFDDVIKLDMAYIDNWTIWKDIKIILLTIKVVILGKGSK